MKRFHSRVLLEENVNFGRPVFRCNFFCKTGNEAKRGFPRTKLEAGRDFLLPAAGKMPSAFRWPPAGLLLLGRNAGYLA
jgi:hypothetical protein